MKKRARTANPFKDVIRKLEKFDFAELDGDERVACLQERENQIRRLKRLEYRLEALGDANTASVLIRALAEARVRPPEEANYSDWSLKIERAANGFIVSHMMQDPGCESVRHVELFEEGRDMEIESELGGRVPEPRDVATYNMLYYVMEYFGIHYAKHKKVNLMIRFECGGDEMQT